MTLYYTYNTVQNLGEVLWFIRTRAAVQMCDQSDAICFLHLIVHLLQVLLCELQDVSENGQDMT